MNELEYTIKQNERAIEYALKNIADAVSNIQEKVASGDFMTSLLSQQHALYVALNITKKSEE